MLELIAAIRFMIAGAKLSKICLFRPWPKRHLPPGIQCLAPGIISFFIRFMQEKNAHDRGQDIYNALGHIAPAKVICR
jgi:hypothetical protein